jgi:hypothetical protein
MFNVDPFLTGSVDEFRIYEGALTASAVASDFAAGPNVVSTPGPSLSIKLGQGIVTLSWPATGPFILATSTNVTGGWAFSTLTTTNQNGQNVATDTINTQAKFYRLQRGP